MTGSSSYRLDELGWLQFDRLCSLVLEADAGLRGLQWRGRGDTARIARVDGPLTLRDRGHRLGGPVTVAGIWIRSGPAPEGRMSGFRDRVVSVPADRTEWLLVMTNLDTADARAALRADPRARDLRVVILGAAEISASLDRDPQLRAAMPSVLGLRDLDGSIDSDVRGRSSFDVGRAQELAWCSGRRARMNAPGMCSEGTGSSSSPARPRWARPRSRRCSGSRTRPTGGRRTSATTPSRCGACSVESGASSSSPMTPSGPRSTARTRRSVGPGGSGGCSRCWMRSTG